MFSAICGQLPGKLVDSVDENQYCGGITSFSVESEVKCQAMGPSSIRNECEFDAAGMFVVCVLAFEA